MDEAMPVPPCALTPGMALTQVGCPVLHNPHCLTAFLRAAFFPIGLAGGRQDQPQEGGAQGAEEGRARAEGKGDGRGQDKGKAGGCERQECHWPLRVAYAHKSSYIGLSRCHEQETHSHSKLCCKQHSLLRTSSCLLLLFFLFRSYSLLPSPSSPSHTFPTHFPAHSTPMNTPRWPTRRTTLAL